MRILQRVKHDLKAGWAAMRYGTAQAASRALEEAELLQLRLELRKLDERIRELYGDIGERAIAVHERGEPVGRVLADAEVARGVEQVLALGAERARLVAEMEEVQDSG